MDMTLFHSNCGKAVGRKVRETVGEETIYLQDQCFFALSGLRRRNSQGSGAKVPKPEGIESLMRLSGSFGESGSHGRFVT